MPKNNSKKEEIWTSGGRKSSTARIVLKEGKGSFVINDQDMSQYFPLLEDQTRLNKPFEVTGLDQGQFDISLKVSGGGKKGQRDACIHAVSRALEQFDPTLRAKLKPEGLLTRDARVKERKKPGLKKARRAPQFSKR